jgi:hypothetical protein
MFRVGAGLAREPATKQRASFVREAFPAVSGCDRDSVAFSNEPRLPTT